ISVFSYDGKLNEDAGKYHGLTIKQARQQVVADLEELGLLGDVEAKKIEMPHSDRSKTPIEPMLADQWFVRMAELAQSAIDAVEDDRVQIFPERYRKSYLDWLGEKRDWPVSRQLWWGHRIPVWSRTCWDEAEQQQALSVAKQLSDAQPEAFSIQIEHPETAHESKVKLPAAFVHVCLRGDEPSGQDALEQAGFKQSPDVLDTWFSSALWPHSTLGWPEQTKELKRYY
ncbi:MAG: class I tRNA ligase family protein, partial [Calditrichaeota bacterium]|nr:class I tRNA ligase family protein [Calditrichota bacterium]